MGVHEDMEREPHSQPGTTLTVIQLNPSQHRHKRNPKRNLNATQQKYKRKPTQSKPSHSTLTLNLSLTLTKPDLNTTQHYTLNPNQNLTTICITQLTQP